MTSPLDLLDLLLGETRHSTLPSLSTTDSVDLLEGIGATVGPRGGVARGGPQVRSPRAELGSVVLETGRATVVEASSRRRSVLRPKPGINGPALSTEVTVRIVFLLPIVGGTRTRAQTHASCHGIVSADRLRGVMAVMARHDLTGGDVSISGPPLSTEVRIVFLLPIVGGAHASA